MALKSVAVALLITGRCEVLEIRCELIDKIFKLIDIFSGQAKVLRKKLEV